MTTELYGLYCAIVRDNADPDDCSRLLVEIPGVTLYNLSWAEACVPPGEHTVPDIGDTVWIMLEAGDPDYPVWIGVLPERSD